MGIEDLRNAADFAHLDGGLVYPVFIDEQHALVTEDGSVLLLPRGMHVRRAGRFGITPEGIPVVDYNAVGDDMDKLALWGARIRQPEILEHIAGQIQQCLAQVPDTAVYTHKGCN